jgi:hypothetical protein
VLARVGAEATGDLAAAARARVLDGSTTLEEAIRVTRQEADVSGGV